MKRIAVLALPALAIALALMAVTATRDTASAQSIDQGPLTIECEMTQTPTPDNDFVGVLDCTLSIELTEPVEYTFTADLHIEFKDFDQNGAPSFGDELLCWEVVTPDGTVYGTCSA